ncbi:PPR domain-containing protein/PPR_1 domain-containing protein/PPR_2 domain-containing protein, partial [Cephalotus follicularis]
GKSIHSHLIRCGLSHDVFVANNLISMYIDLTFYTDAQKMFDEMSERNVVTWTSMVSAYNSNGRPDKAIELYTKMLESDSEKPNGFMYSAVLKACGLMGDIELGKVIHKVISRDKLDHDVVLMNTLMDMYVKCGNLSDALIVFDGILCPNLISWNTIISGYCKEGLMEEAVNLFNQMVDRNAVSWNSIIAGFTDIGSLNALKFVRMMHQEGHKLDKFTFPCALKTCGYHGLLAKGKQIHCYVLKSGFKSSCFTVSALVDMYSNCSVLDEAIKLFDEYSSCNPSVRDNLALWNSMLSGCVINEHNRAAVRLFRRLPNKDIVAWSGLIMGCAKMGLNSLVFSIFRDMVSSDLEVDQFVISCVLKVCSSLASLESGKQIHAFCIKSGYESEGVTVTALVDVYSKCGEIEDGLVLFNCTPERDVVSWTGIIVGCGQNGRAKEAIQYFHEMILLELKPNEVTFLGVLSACRHAGLVEEAWTIFKSMIYEYGLEPYLEHYYCMVDLLGQAGCFKEAEELIAGMPVKPDKTIWGSLLGSCGTHNNIELVNSIAKHLLTTSPDDPSIYVMLSNVYATLGMWVHLSKVR